MADHTTGNTSLMGFVFTLAGVIYSKITASDLAAVFTCILAIINITIAWPKLKIRLKQIFKKQNHE